MDLDQSLEKLRALKNSKIPVQQKQGTLFAAIEATICENGKQPPAAAYFGALVSLLDQAEAADAVVYLLSVILPHISQAILVQKMDVVVSKVAPLLTAENSENSLIRSCIKVLEQLLVAQSYGAWQIPFEQMGPLRTFSGVMALVSDSRPKVRRQALETVSNVLSTVPSGSTRTQHPALFMAADSSLESVTDNADSTETAPLMHALQFVKAVLQVGWPVERYEILCSSLLAITRTTDQYIVMAVFDLFEVMFQGIVESDGKISKKTVVNIIDTIRGLVPSNKDKQLAPSWFAVLAQASATWVAVDHEGAVKALPSLFDTNIEYFNSECPSEVVESSAQCLVAFISTILTPDVVLKNETQEILEDIGKKLFSLLHVQYQGAWAGVCQVYIAFFDTVSYKAPIENSVRVIGVLRSDERLSASRQATDEVISAAIRAYGPEKLLELIPLQLSVSSNGQGMGRAWMLPLLRDSIQNATITHFREYFVPLAKEFDEKSKSMSNQKNAKIVATVRDQIWSLLPHYMDLPKDVKEGLTQEFIQLLLSILYEKIEYRTMICQSLKIIVQSNEVYATGAIENPLMLEAFSIKKAKASLKHLSKTFAADILKALLNVYTTASEQTRPVLLETIDVYLGIISAEEITQLFNQMSTVLFESLKSGKLDLCAVMMDIISAIVPYLDEDGYKIFYNIFTALAPHTDNHQIQKKVYGAFSRLSEVEHGKELIASKAKGLADTLIELSPTVQVPARRTRLEALHAVVENLPSENLYVIPAILSEVMLCTKDTNEKTRDTAYSLLALMGERCKEGGTIDHSELDFFDDEEEAPASLEEYFRMITAGLLASTPNSISACILALSFVFHEFNEDIDEEFAKEVCEAVWLFLTNKNREIVNSTLGFVKVSVLTLPAETLDENLGDLVENLLAWNKEHSNHFKSKVRHIIERLIRKMGYDRVKEVFPEEHIKHLQNIQKSRLRSKRKKATEDEVKSKGRQFEDELDEALYASDEEEQEQEQPRNGKRDRDQQQKVNGKNNGSKKQEQFILAGDEPLDLMDQGALTHISSSKPQQQKKRELRHKLHEKDGKIIIRDDEDMDDNAEPKDAINAYLEAVKSGPIRTERGKLKYKRGKRSKEDDEESDNEAPTQAKKARKMVKPKTLKPKNKPHRRQL